MSETSSAGGSGAALSLSPWGPLASDHLWLLTRRGAVPCRLERNEAGLHVLRFEADPGLMQLSVVMDASGFDWSSLYRRLTLEHSKGELTGPWDFDIADQNRPLVPSYRVALNGRAIGNWFFQRVSLEDLRHKRFRGNMAFHVQRAGVHVLRLEAMRLMNVRWSAAWLEPDPDDRLEPPPPGLAHAPGRVPAARWPQHEFWKEQRRLLATTHALFQQPLRHAFDWAINHSGAIDLLCMAHHMNDGEVSDRALNRALESIDRIIERPTWGAQNPDAYSHNGDMDAAYNLAILAWAYHALGPSLGEIRKAKLLDKVRIQGDIFFDLALLNRDYWGGSLLQDHGWNSLHLFAVASLHMYGVVEEAARWVSYALPRVRRAQDAMPRDGVIPPSSYGAPYLYLAEPARYRRTLLALGGPDVFDAPSFHAVVNYAWTVLRENEGVMPVYPGPVDFIGSGAFFCQLAAKFRDGRAAWLHRQMLGTSQPHFYHDRQQAAYHHSCVEEFFCFDPGVTPTVEPTLPRRHLVHFVDSGLAHYRDDTSGATLAIQCGPWCGYHAYRHAQGPCDRMTMDVGAGHVCLYIDGKLRLASPDGGYSLRTILRSTLLVNDKGQRGDMGYPMSIPSMTDDGREIAGVSWCESQATGEIRLNLQPAYPEEAGLVVYLRQILLSSTRKVIVRDRVMLNQPGKISWLFQMMESDHPKLEGLRCSIGDHPPLLIEPLGEHAALTTKIAPTPVVYGYASSSHFARFVHLRYDTAEPIESVTVEFGLSWSA